MSARKQPSHVEAYCRLDTFATDVSGTEPSNGLELHRKDVFVLLNRFDALEDRIAHLEATASPDA